MIFYQLFHLNIKFKWTFQWYFYLIFFYILLSFKIYIIPLNILCFYMMLILG